MFTVMVCFQAKAAFFMIKMMRVMMLNQAGQEPSSTMMNYKSLHDNLCGEKSVGSISFSVRLQPNALNIKVKRVIQARLSVGST